MTKGQLSFVKTFWLFGVLTLSIMFALAFMYVGDAIAEDTKGYQTLSAFKTVLVPIGTYSYCVFLGIWRSAKQLSGGKRFISRYLSTVLLSFAVITLLFSWLYCLVFAVVVYLALKGQSIENKKIAQKVG
ncbi:hypothetical protein [Vibrio owensii]|uniref:hypothetical protein n=1 Tax=Vibrio owensii TaxID=696485 RepID=UPI0018F24CB5|nr:hypothetical protein [Vibrio owensii]